MREKEFGIFRIFVYLIASSLNLSENGFGRDWERKKDKEELIQLPNLFLLLGYCHVSKTLYEKLYPEFLFFTIKKKTNQITANL